MIFLVGPHSAGKTIAAKFLSNLGFSYIDLGPCLRLIQKCSCPEKTFSEWCLLGEQKFGKLFTDKLTAIIVKIAINQIKNLKSDLIIVGSRSYKNIKFICKNVQHDDNPQDKFVVYIDSSIAILRKRDRERSDPWLLLGRASLREFRLLLSLDSKIGLDEIKNHADGIIYNDGTLDQFHRKIHQLIGDNFKLSGNSTRGINVRPAIITDVFIKKFGNYYKL